MKKIYVLLTSILLVGTMTFAQEEAEGLIAQEAVSAEEISSQGTPMAQESISAQGGTTLSKGDSFMVSMGMNDSSIVVGGEVGGAASGVAVATSTGSGLSNQGMNPGHTPYIYTK